MSSRHRRLDERFGVGFFEDDDLCVRVRRPATSCWCPGRLHPSLRQPDLREPGHRLRNQLRENLASLQGQSGAKTYGRPTACRASRRNKRRNQRRATSLPPPHLRPTKSSAGPPTHRPACRSRMIVKNEEHNLPRLPRVRRRPRGRDRRRGHRLDRPHQGDRRQVRAPRSSTSPGWTASPPPATSPCATPPATGSSGWTPTTASTSRNRERLRSLFATLPDRPERRPT